MKSISTLLSLPVMLLNFGGGIVGGLWLIFLGKWSLVVGVLLASWVASFTISLILAPTLIWAHTAIRLLERKKFIASYIFVLLSWVSNYAVMILWSVFAFLIVMGYHETGSVWPYLLLAYATATGVWTYMAQSETAYGDETPGTTIPVYFLCLGTVFMMGVVVWGNPTAINLGIALGISMCVSFILQSIVFFDTARTIES